MTWNLWLWSDAHKKSLQIKRKRSRVKQSTRQRGAKRKRNGKTCVWHWYDLWICEMCVNDKCAKYVLQKNIFSFTKKGLRHVACIWQRNVRIRVYESTIVFLKIRSCFLIYICPYIYQRHVRTYAWFFLKNRVLFFELYLRNGRTYF